MADNELSRIIGLIMENPKLIDEIKNLSSKAGAEDEHKSIEETSAESAIQESAKEEIAPPLEKSNRVRRRELLSALKPYVSEERGRAIDSVMSIADILEVMRSK